MRLRLGVNIDHAATLRQARGTPYPDLILAARLCESAGARGITIHLREDRRHIQDRDVYALRKTITTRLNLEMANNPDILAVALAVLPDEVCLVPERRQELTTEGGLDVAGQERRLRPTIHKLREAGIAVSLFIAPDPRQIEAAARLRAPYIELHTGTFCNSQGAAAHRELQALCAAARQAHALGIKVNAGHGINLDNIGAILRIPHLDTLNIGHSIVCQAVFVGLSRAVREMLTSMKAYRGDTLMAERVIGTGVDLVENDRIRQLLEKWGPRFKDRVFLSSEQVYCDDKASPWLYYAGRFAVKEAVSKAFGTGIGPSLGWLDIEVVRNPESGAPSVGLTPHGQELARQQGVDRVLISLSHTHHFAVAHALLVGQES